MSRLHGLATLAALLALSVVMHAQQEPDPDNAILDVLVWGVHMKIDPERYSGRLRTEIEDHLRRAAAYRSTRPVPSSSELAMSLASQVAYERRLAAVSDDPDAPSLAVAYLESALFCYEWEGSSDCPEREARFADEYQATHPNGPFRAYLPLLAAHRWLCTAEAYEREGRPSDASRSIRMYEERLAVALESQTLLIRTAAEQLKARESCHPR